MHKIKTQTTIIGAGASGLMLASFLPKQSYMIIEHNDKIGAKLLVSGGGKCNITNTQMSSDNFLANAKFVNTVFDIFNHHNLLNWLKRQGLNPILKNQRDYFCPNSSKQLLDIFQNSINPKNLKLNTKVLKVQKKSNHFIIQTDKQEILSKQVVIASGGLSFTTLGASAIGYEIAQSFGHNINQTSPALVGFTLQKEQFFFKSLSGLSTEVKINIGAQTYRGSLLFTHKGISGPVILNSSLHWQKGKIVIDFLPDFDFKILKSSNKLISTILPLPKRLAKALLEHIKLQEISCRELTNNDIEKLSILKRYSFAPAGTFGYSKAEVTKGGISTDEIDANAMMSKKIDGLYFIGEVLDVTGELGGYNLQWAFSSAVVCAKRIMSSGADEKTRTSTP